ncbi:hypothetical protein T484DRAFT_1808134 [Baffinella frigidus]|nr:hypothetical protein T484DRAFT_1808134 [Cryptophyta sp. CCMP2293]
MINGAKLALDLIDFDKAVEKAMWYATGNTVVVPTFEDAKRLAFGSAERLSCKVVSANDASVITKSGAITGGDYSSYVNKAQRFGASDFEKLQTKYQQNHAALQAVLGSIAQHEKEFGRLQRHRQEVDHKATTAKKLRDGMDGDFTTRSKEIDILKKQEKEEIDILKKQEKEEVSP